MYETENSHTDITILLFLPQEHYLEQSRRQEPGIVHSRFSDTSHLSSNS